MHRYFGFRRTPCALGALAAFALLGGCAGPSIHEWDDSLYSRIVTQREHPNEAVTSTSEQNHASLESSESSDSHESHESHESPGAETPVSTDSEALRLEDAIEYALLNHPALRRSAYGIRAAAGREAQSRLFPNPAFMFDAESFGADAGDGGETTYMLQQEFVTAGKLKKAGLVAEADRLIAQSSFQETAYLVTTRVRRSFTAVLAAEQRLESQRELLTLANELLATADARVEVGDATEPDRLRAEVVKEQAEIDLRAAEFDVAAARRGLASAIGLTSLHETALAGDLLMMLPSLPEEAEAIRLTLANNKRVERARIAIERAKRAHELAKAVGVPNVTAAVGPRYSDLDNETTMDMGIGIAAPIFDRNQGEIAATIAERLAAGASLESTQLALIEALSRAWSSYESARYAVDAYQNSVMPKAERTLEMTREAYRVGKTNYLRLLDSQQTYVRARIAYVDALEALHQAAVVIEGLMQTTPPRLDAEEAINEGSM